MIELLAFLKSLGKDPALKSKGIEWRQGRRNITGLGWSQEVTTWRRGPAMRLVERCLSKINVKAWTRRHLRAVVVDR